jgi:nicotinamidase-related amidase
MALDPLSRPALVVVDMQNDFVRVGAPLEVPEARATIGPHQTLLDACRRRGIPVVYTKFVAGPERTLVWEWSPQLAPPVHCCW